jgi:hypothetical protein
MDNVSRIGHDQLFKQVLEAFFPDFLRLFDPDTAARLDLTTVTFRNPEVFIDLPQGERRTADVVAEVRSLEGEPELVIVHVEIQREREPQFSRRMFQYYVALRQRENKPVIPIALVFYAGREGIAREEYEEAVFGEPIMTFRYLQISLPLLRAEDYVQAEQVLGAGLASVMRLPRDRQAQIRLHLACLRRVHDAERSGQVNAARTFLLVNLVATYLPLTDEEREALRVQLSQEGDVTMEATELTWADRISLRARREYVRRAIQLRFGRVSPEVDALVEATETEEGLTALFDRAVVAQTEDELLRPLDEAQS